MIHVDLFLSLRLILCIALSVDLLNACTLCFHVILLIFTFIYDIHIRLVVSDSWFKKKNFFLTYSLIFMDSEFKMFDMIWLLNWNFSFKYFHNKAMSLCVSKTGWNQIIFCATNLLSNKLKILIHCWRKCSLWKVFPFF